MDHGEFLAMLAEVGPTLVFPLILIPVLTSVAYSLFSPSSCPLGLTQCQHVCQPKYQSQFPCEFDSAIAGFAEYAFSSEGRFVLREQLCRCNLFECACDCEVRQYASELCSIVQTERTGGRG